MTGDGGGGAVMEGKRKILLGPHWSLSRYSTGITATLTILERSQWPLKISKVLSASADLSLLLLVLSAPAGPLVAPAGPECPCWSPG
jgi:hypothetical protein